MSSEQAPKDRRSHPARFRPRALLLLLPVLLPMLACRTTPPPASLTVADGGLPAPPRSHAPPAPPADPLETASLAQLPVAVRDALQRVVATPLPPPGPHDWLANHEEPGQTYRQFVAGRFQRPDEDRRFIYLQPLGSFVPDQSPALPDLQEFTEAYFGLPVRVLPPLYLLRPELVGITTRLRLETGRRQLLAPDLLELLRRRLPPDAYCLLGVTMEDLYPEESWNFVFGLATFRERVGVFSFARYDPRFYRTTPTSGDQLLLLRRSVNILAHETAHMFGLAHCIWHHCNVNGSNHLEESDRSPIEPCPVCLRKLHHAIGFDPIQRWRRLALFFRRTGLVREAEAVEQSLKDRPADP